MKHLLFLVIFFFSVENLYSQTSKKSIVDLDFSHLKKRETNFDFGGEITTTRPKLQIQTTNTSTLWEDEVVTYDGNMKMSQYLNGGETITIKVKVKNVNNALAKDIILKASYESWYDNQVVPNKFDIEYPKSIGNLDFNEEREVEIKITADVSVQPSNTIFNLRAEDLEKQGAISYAIAGVKTDIIRYGNVKYFIDIVETSDNKNFSGNSDKIINPNEFVKLKVTVENVGDGPAYDFKLRFGKDDDLYVRENFGGVHPSSVWEQDILLPSRNGDERKEFFIGYFFKNTEEFEDYAKGVGELPFNFGMEDKITKLSLIEYPLKISLNSDNLIDFGGKTDIVKITTGDEKDIERALSENKIFKSPLDPKKFALIIGNSNYLISSKLKIANEDRLLIRDFFVNGFGVPEKNIIRGTKDLTYTGLKNIIKKDVNNAISGVEDVKLYVYYSGHGLGIKYEGKSEGLLMPVDADPDFNAETSSIKQSTLYSDIYNLSNLDHAYVFIDACFSGEDKDGVGITTKYKKEITDAPKSGRRTGSSILPPKFVNKITLFSSSSGSQRSWSYKKFAEENNIEPNNYSLFTTFCLGIIYNT